MYGFRSMRPEPLENLLACVLAFCGRITCQLSDRCSSLLLLALKKPVIAVTPTVALTVTLKVTLFVPLSVK